MVDETILVDHNCNNFTQIHNLWHQYLLVASVCVLTSSINTGVRCSAFIHIEIAVSSVEAFFARAFVVVSLGMTRCLVTTRLVCTVILLSAVSSSPAQRTRALVGVKGGQCAGATILTGTGVTGIGHTCLAQRVLKAQGTLASEGRCLAGISGWGQDTGSSILANLFSSVTMVSKLAVFSSVVRWASRMRILNFLY